MGIALGISEVIDGHDLHIVRMTLLNGLEREPANATKSVNTDSG
jgi:hypothetical protein